MGAFDGDLVRVVIDAGAELRPGSLVRAINTDGSSTQVRTADGQVDRARHVLAAISPALLGDLAPGALDFGVATARSTHPLHWAGTSPPARAERLRESFV
jgi:hypothetical protein